VRTSGVVSERQPGADGRAASLGGPDTQALASRSAAPRAPRRRAVERKCGCDGLEATPAFVPSHTLDQTARHLRAALAPYVVELCCPDQRRYALGLIGAPPARHRLRIRRWIDRRHRYRAVHGQRA
jgi:hypothetical protein